MIKGWEIKRLKELGVTQTGTTPPTKDKSNYGDYINFVKPAHFNKDGSINTDFEGLSEKGLSKGRLIERNSILMVCIGATIGKTSLIDIPVSCNQQINSFTPNSNLSNRFFYYALSREDFYKKVLSSSSQATIPIINKTKWENIEVSYPSSLAEQKQIVEILDTAFEAIEKVKTNIEKNLQNTKELFDSKLNEIFSQKGEGWEEKTLGEIGKVSMCKRILKKQTNSENGIPFYKIGTFGKVANAFIDEDIYTEFRNKYSFPKKGDILLSASGTIGRRVIYDGKPAYFQDSNIVWINNNEEKVLNKYLYEFYGFCNWNPSRGATISRLYNDDLRRIKISIPSIIKQKEIVKEINDLSNKTKQLEQKYQQKLDNLEELKKSLLQKAFSGELTN